MKLRVSKPSLSKIARHIRKIRIPRAVAVPVVALALTLGAGIWIGRATAPNASVQQPSKRVSQSADSKTKEEAREAAKVESGYIYGKDRIETDQKTKRLTAEQAGKVRTKLDEVYAFRKDLLHKPTGEVVAARSEKRQELRSWATKNALSTRYFIRLY